MSSISHSQPDTFTGPVSPAEISSFMKTFFGSFYEISSYYDRGFLIDEIMIYLITYDLFHDPYQPGMFTGPVSPAELSTLPRSWFSARTASWSTAEGSSTFSPTIQTLRTRWLPWLCTSRRTWSAWAGDIVMMRMIWLRIRMMIRMIILWD